MQWTRNREVDSLDRISGCGSYEWRVAEDLLVWSAGLVDLYGVTDQAPGKENAFIRFVHPDDRLRVEAETSSFFEHGDTYEHEFRIIRPDGQIIHIHDRGEIERAADGTPLALRGINIDVTRQRQTLAREHGACLNTASGIGFYKFDIAQQRSWWSDETFRILDVEVQDFMDLRAITIERVVEEDRARFLALQEDASRRIGPFEIEYRFRHRDGSVHWIRDRGETLGHLDPVTGLAWQVRGTVTDISEHKKRGMATPAGSETFRKVIERAPFGICLVDAELTVVELSAGAREILGVTGSVIGHQLGDLLRSAWTDTVADDLVARFRETLATGIRYHATATAEHHDDGKARQVFEWSLEQTQLPDGQPSLNGYFYDLSERTEQEATLRENEERLQLAYDASGMGAWDFDLTTGLSVWSPQLYELLGLDPALPASGDLFFERIHPDDRQAVQETIEASIESGKIFEAGFRVWRGDGALRHFAGRGRIVARKDGRPTRMIGVNFDVTERRYMERKVRDSEQQLRLVLDSAVAFIGVLDLDGTLREANATALAAGGLVRDDVIGKPFWETSWWSHDPDVAERLRAAVMAAVAGEAVQYDAVVRMQGDTRMTINVLLSPIFEDGQVLQVVASGFDITEREKAMERVHFLMSEINHRAKNTITLVQAIARQIWRSTPDDFFPRFESRLQALAHSHNLLVNDDWDGAWVEDIGRTQLAHFGDLIDTRIHLNGARTRVTADAAQALGMAFHELATNAGKYGALSNQDGQIDVDWAVQRNSAGEGELTLSWVERGGPRVKVPERKGFGSTVLDRIVSGSLSGKVEIAYPPEGLRWRVTCPDSCLLS